MTSIDLAPRQVPLPATLGLGFVLEGPAGGWDWEGTSAIHLLAEDGAPRHVEPAALVALVAWTNFLRSRGRNVILDESLKSPYSWNTGLLRGLAGQGARSADVTPTPQYFPLCEIKGEEAISAISKGVIQTLHITGPQAISALGGAIHEILRNAEEHSESTTPTLFAAGYFKLERRVTFAVADTGVGIRSTLLRKRVLLNNEDDAVAIEKAIQPRITGAGKPGIATAPDNAGLGLHTTRMSALDSRGAMLVCSGTAAFMEKGFGTARTQPVPRWWGTLVCVTLYPEKAGSFSLTPAGIGSTGVTPIHFGKAPTDALLFHPPIDAVRFAANKSWAREQRPAVIAALTSGRDVGVDFSGATYTTQSAMHALLHEPIAQIGLAAVSKLHFIRTSPQIEAVIRLVTNYALSEPEGSLGSTKHGDQ
jgi:hypothetical protein